MQHDKELDARGLNCPLPILRTKKALKEIPFGETIEVLATDLELNAQGMEFWLDHRG